MISTAYEDFRRLARLELGVGSDADVARLLEVSPADLSGNDKRSFGRLLDRWNGYVDRHPPLPHLVAIHHHGGETEVLLGRSPRS